MLTNLSWAKKNGNLEIIRGSILDSDLLLECFDNADFIFHQAAIRITQCAKSNRLAHEVMSTGTFNVAEAAVKSKVKKVIAASSASIYGQAKFFRLKKIIILTLMIHYMGQQKPISKKSSAVLNQCTILIT